MVKSTSIFQGGQCETCAFLNTYTKDSIMQQNACWLNLHLSFLTFENLSSEKLELRIDLKGNKMLTTMDGCKALKNSGLKVPPVPQASGPYLHLLFTATASATAQLL